jgi:alpha-D-ribose 1-methylphosphonate 5-triphosphate synthase subunit PhnH
MDASTPGAIYEGGFADPVFGSQAVFRGVMDAMANPGRIVDLGSNTQAPAPLQAAASAVLATLADYDTPVWFEADNAADAANWLTFHTGAPVTTYAAQASFAVLATGSAPVTWSRFAIGAASYPDRSTTLLLPVDDFTSGRTLTLKGPGIEATITIAPAGLPEGFGAAMTKNAARFPLGLDLILVCNSAILALPRTTRIAEA